MGLGLPYWVPYCKRILFLGVPYFRKPSHRGIPARRGHVRVFAQTPFFFSHPLHHESNLYSKLTLIEPPHISKVKVPRILVLEYYTFILSFGSGFLEKLLLLKEYRLVFPGSTPT